MSTSRGHDDIRELLGAYALDAVEADEVTVVEDHLRDCPRCRAEVAEHRETAAALASGTTAVPTELWDRIADALDAPPPPVELQPLRPSNARRLDRPRVLMLAAAAVLAVVVLAGGLVAQNRRLDRMESALDRRDLSAAALAAFGDPSASRTTLRSADGELVVQAVVLDDGSGYLLADGLPGLRTDRTYQLWAQVGIDSLVSAGVLGPDPEVVAFHVDGRVGALAVTDERRGGVVQSEQEPVVSGAV